jgi:hypothetical protein
MQEVQERLQQYLLKSLHDHGNTKLVNILEIGLASCLEQETWTCSDLCFISEEWRPAVQEQNEIGWFHLYRGRIGKKLIQAMEQHYRNLGLNSLKYNGATTDL